MTLTYLKTKITLIKVSIIITNDITAQPAVGTCGHSVGAAWCAATSSCPLTSGPRMGCVASVSVSYTHQPANQVVGVGVVLLGGQLRWVELGGPQDLQHPLQGLGHGDRAALLGRVDDVYHLRTRKQRDFMKCMKSPLPPHFVHAAVMEWRWGNQWSRSQKYKRITVWPCDTRCTLQTWSLIWVHHIVRETSAARKLVQ